MLGMVMGPLIHMEHGTIVNGSLQMGRCCLPFLMDGTGEPLRPMETLRTAAQRIEMYVLVYDMWFSTIFSCPELDKALMFHFPLSRLLLWTCWKRPLDLLGIHEKQSLSTDSPPYDLFSRLLGSFKGRNQYHT